MHPSFHQNCLYIHTYLPISKSKANNIQVSIFITTMYYPFINNRILLRSTRESRLMLKSQSRSVVLSISYSLVCIRILAAKLHFSMQYVCMYQYNNSWRSLAAAEAAAGHGAYYYVGGRSLCSSSTECTGSTEPQKQQQSTGKPRREQRPLKRPPRLLSRIV